MADAIQMLNQLVVKMPNFLPLFLEKLNLYMSNQNWTLVLETVDRILSIEPKSVLALMVCNFFFLIILLLLYKISLAYFYFR